ncbi:MAG: hypothetical protein R2828_23600 [Saprospiraceae bacterium]
MLKLSLLIAFIFCSIIVIAQPGKKPPVGGNEGTKAPSSPTWSQGIIDVVESFSDKIYIRWQGAKTQDCAQSDDVAVTAESLGGEAALDRAFKLITTAAVSGNPVRFRLDGCIGGLQKGTVVQLCVHADCRY